MINILITEIGSGYGGSGSYLCSFLKFLDREKIHPTVVFYHNAEGPAVKRIMDLGVKVIFLDKNKRNAFENAKTFSFFPLKKIAAYCNLLQRIFFEYFPEVNKIRRIIKKNKISLTLLNSEVYVNIPAALASISLGIPCLARKSGTGNDNSRKLKKISSAWVDCFIASSEYEANVHKENEFPYKRMEVVYEGVDTSRFMPGNNRNDIRSEFGLTAQDRLVGSISRIDDGKGHDDFLRAAAAVTKSAPETKFIIVGDDCGVGGKTTLAQLKKISAELGIQKNVIFTGWRNDITDILHAVDIFVHCPNSWNEGMGIATLEAQACGKPVIVTKNGGLAETTIDGFNGYVVPVGDYNSLADKIVLLCKDNELRTRMGANSRRNIEDRFDMKKTVAHIEKIILSYTDARTGNRALI